MSDILNNLEDSKNIYECKDCETEFQSASEFHQHDCKTSVDINENAINGPEPNGSGKYKCETCEKWFKEKYYFQQHMLIHSDKYDFVCELCQKGFKSKIRLRCHYISHRTAPRYFCPECNKGFKESGNLKKIYAFTVVNDPLCAMYVIKHTLKKGTCKIIN